MVVPSFAALLTDRFAAALPDAGFDPQIRLSEHADLQADGVLGAARALRRDPRQLAAEVAARLDGDGLIAGLRVTGPGFVNLTLSTTALLERVAARLADPRLGVGLPAAGARTVLDYSHPNVAKEMHVGHLRSTIIGDALARVLTHLGGTVVRQNHIGDWGTQYGMLIQYLDEHPADTSALTVRYRTAYALFQRDPAFAQRCRRRVVALQGGDPASLAAWRAMVLESTRYFSDVYERLGVLLTDADIAGESSYNPMLAGVAADLERLGVARVSDGALCVFDAGDPGAAPLIVRKSDGGYGYPATDLAAVRHRVAALHAGRIVYVVDARQAPHFRMVFDAARRAGWLPPEVEAVHAAFGMVLGADGRPFKTRSGDTAPLVGLLTEAVERAAAVVAAKNPALGPDDVAARARDVGIGAVKYADLSTSRTRDYLYDPDRMMALTGNTGVYLQYAHARLCSILARAGDPAPFDPAGGALQDVERALILRLDGFGDVLTGVAGGCEPHRLCAYLHDLAQTVTAFYERCPVLKAPPPLRAQRVALCALTARTLATGLGLLGIAAPPRL
ncbi:arginine--tRNA ligase [Dactylosporangium aurantiacum]|uniref:Arginine--tRNA ligase n=1 Tax=Dactylosporangium aurantiacum TaxID=35754 RepID=A0A9Q9IIU3_9ACTN|nr:arginine--tRNA ligase [Dactylosporangium aurantiacum]MDG6102211.1 arginine--tRNA ligase [Dactylosporangium aurantiacum]UWZ53475.1 arginine--tRNA ligase [Dactylosporangium aurantiacum]